MLNKGGILLKFLREFAYQCLILVTVFGLVFVAFDLSDPAAVAFEKVDEQTAVKVFQPFSKTIQSGNDTSADIAEVNVNYFINILLPFIIYLLACGGFIFLILENIRLWKMMNLIKPVNRLMWTTWIVVLGLLSLLPVYLGTSLIFEGLWYIFIIIALLCLFYWTYWASRN
ncbi:MAG: hypothetical protein ACYCYE_08210 [Clostridia bacterium]